MSMESSKIYNIGSRYFRITYDKKGFWITDDKGTKNMLYFTVGIAESLDKLKILNIVIGPLHISIA
jgi:hypothetical protein